MKATERMALTALVLIMVTTVAWWAAALWPLPPGTPEWVVRARAACFGAGRNELPNAGGWLLLVGSPLTMMAALLIIAGPNLRRGLQALLLSPLSRTAAGGAVMLFVLLLGVTVQRSASALGLLQGESWAVRSGDIVPQPLDREAPPLVLTSQRGEQVSLEQFRGQPVLVTFAFARCETVCPVIVHESIQARREHFLETGTEVVLLIVTLDPWRDVPQRLPHIAASWELQAGEFVLGGAIPDVEGVLDAWQVPRSRDSRTGEIVHPSLVYIIDARGRLAYGVPGVTPAIRKALAAL